MGCHRLALVARLATMSAKCPGAEMAAIDLTLRCDGGRWDRFWANHATTATAVAPGPVTPNDRVLV